MEKVMVIAKEKMMDEIITIKDDKAWVTKFRNFMIVLLVGFALGTMVSNATFTYHLQQDCDTMKQFRIGKLAYTCMVR
jgi:hypothetical protein